MENYQHVYLIQEREFLRLKENVYKVGKTIQEFERFRSYPKGSVVHLMVSCDDCSALEKKVIFQFKQKYRQCKEYGTEYFEGNLDDMIATITFIRNNLVKVEEDVKKQQEEQVRKYEEENTRLQDQEAARQRELETNKLAEIRRNEQEQRNKFYCDLCKVDCKRSDSYSHHVLTKKHLTFYERLNNVDLHYRCETCNYFTNWLCDINKHKLTKSHIRREQETREQE
jgi:hypothetical protein